jgi:predicted phage baseplate assembly protein
MSEPGSAANAAEATCGCCDGFYAATPVEVFNRPGLSAVQYRVGTHPAFKRTMLAILSAEEHSELKALKTRSDDDFAVGLLDSWAVLLDILTFYQERIINESFLRTATERRSLLEQARLIGYEPRPGVAAASYLAFTVDDPTVPLPAGQALAATPTSATGVVIEKGTRVQSIPAPGENAQIFETTETIVGHAGWNALRPRLTEPHPLAVDLESLTIAGVTSLVKPGDAIMIAAAADPSKRIIKRVVRMTTDVKVQVMRLDLVPSPKPVPPRRRRIVIGKFIKRGVSLNDEFLRDELIVGKSWKQDVLLAMAFQKKWSPVAIQTAVKAHASLPESGRSIPESRPTPEAPPNQPPEAPALNGVIAFRERAALFGHNAPQWGSLPADQRDSTNGIYKDNWEGKTLLDDQDGNNTAYIYLDRTYPAIVTGSWIVLESPTAEPGTSPHAYQVMETTELSRAAYAMSTKITRLTVHQADHFDQFRLRHTTVHAVSEVLDLAPLPIADPIAGSRLTLDRADLSMKVGQTVIVTGQRSDLRDVTVSEAMRLADVTLEEGFTTLTFTQSLANQYIRGSVTINANVAAATHGETKEEILGSGDGSRPFQRFSLRQPPLTYVSAPVPGGGESTLDLRVNDLRWREVSSLYGLGPTDHAYVLQTDDDGNTAILFGDGISGARPATGQHNIRATYRRGIGAGGNVKARQLGLLMARPLGVREVTNPLDAAGGADPETRDDIRSNAPLAIRTLDRIVSLQDYEDFARAFSGIGKAAARWTWNGAQRLVLITVAGSKGAVVEPTGRLAENLSRAMRAAGDPFVPFNVVSYRPAFFKLAARVNVHGDYRPERVIEAVQERVRTAFSFERREFGQPVAFSELIAVLQQEQGVVAVNLTQFHRSDEDPAGSPVALLDAAPAQTGGGGEMLGAELLLLEPSPLSDIGVMS